jgi:hypothetical protein
MVQLRIALVATTLSAARIPGTSKLRASHDECCDEQARNSVLAFLMRAMWESKT